MAVAISYDIGGVTWHTIAEGACLIFLASLLLGLRVGALVRAACGNLVAYVTVLIYAAGQTLLLISINYPWHAAMAETFACYAVYATFAALRAESLPLRFRNEALVHVGLACVLLILSKPNTAFPAIMLCFVVLLRAGIEKRSLILVGISSLILASAALACVHTSLLGMISSYMGLTGRLLPKAFANGILYAIYVRYGLANLLVYAILAPAVTAFLLFTWNNRRDVLTQPVMLLAIGAILIAILGMGTNFDFKLTDTPLALLGLSLGMTSAGVRIPQLTFRTTVATLSLLALAFYFGRGRFRMQIVGAWADDKCSSNVTFEDRFLGKMVACSDVPETLHEVDQVLAAHPGARVFFGPSLEFLYAGRGIASPLHLPNWWDPGSSFPLKKSGQIARAWESDHFDLLIFPKGEDLAQIPVRISQDIDAQYVPLKGMTELNVYALAPEKK